MYCLSTTTVVDPFPQLVSQLIHKFGVSTPSLLGLRGWGRPVLGAVRGDTRGRRLPDTPSICKTVKPQIFRVSVTSTKTALCHSPPPHTCCICKTRHERKPTHHISFLGSIGLLQPRIENHINDPPITRPSAVALASNGGTGGETGP